MRCPICLTHEIKSTDPEVDACIDCRMRGLNFEFYLLSPVRNCLLEKIRKMDHVLSANVWHVGGGMYQLAIILTDGRLVQPGAALTVEGEVKGMVSAIPPLGTPWVILIRTPKEGEENEWTDSEGEILPEPLDDDELVTEISELA